MEQSDLSAPTQDTPAAAPRRNTIEPLAGTRPVPTSRPATTTSNSVPTLRFPRPAGNVQLSNWISSSHPDIMRSSSFPDPAPIDDDDGYEVIDTDGDTQPDALSLADDAHLSDLGDDVQSLADTDTGTDAYTNDVDMDSSEDEDILSEPHPPAGQAGGVYVDMDDAGVHMKDTMADRTLDHPTRLFHPASSGLSRRSSASDNHHQDDLILERALSAAALARERAAAISSKLSEKDTVATDRKPATSRNTVRSSYAEKAWDEVVNRLGHDSVLRKGLQNALIILLLSTALYSAKQCGISWWSGWSTGAGGVISSAPVASVSSTLHHATTAVVTSTSTVTSTVTSTKTNLETLQMTSISKSIMTVSPPSDTQDKAQLCSAVVSSRNEILLQIPQQHITNWVHKEGASILVTRGSQNVTPQSNIKAVDEGFLIRMPHREAHGVLNVSIVTTRKPKIHETYQVNLGSFMIVDAIDAGKQLMKGFAQSVVDTVNGTTAWVEETCMPALDQISKQGSLSDSVLQGFHNAADIALNWSSQVLSQVKQSITEERVRQAETELLRQAQDMGDELALGLLKGQLSSKLWWLKLRGEMAEYERYLAAAGAYYQQKQEDAATARRARADRVKKEIRSRRKQDRQQEKRPFWKVHEGGS